MQLFCRGLAPASVAFPPVGEVKGVSLLQRSLRKSMTNHNPAKPTRTIVLNGVTYTLHYSHKDFVNAEYALRKQGIEVSLLGPGSIEFWSDVTKAMDGERAEHVRELLQKASSSSEENTVTDVVLFDIDFWKIDVVLYVGLLRSIRELSFDLCQDFMSHDPAQQGYIVGTVLQAALEAIQSYLPKKPERKDTELPLAQETGGGEELPPPDPSESMSLNFG